MELLSWSHYTCTICLSFSSRHFTFVIRYHFSHVSFSRRAREKPPLPSDFEDNAVFILILIRYSLAHSLTHSLILSIYLSFIHSLTYSFFRFCEFSSGGLQSLVSISFLILIRYSLTHSFLSSLLGRVHKFAINQGSRASIRDSFHPFSACCARRSLALCLSRKFKSLRFIRVLSDPLLAGAAVAGAVVCPLVFKRSARRDSL